MNCMEKKIKPFGLLLVLLLPVAAVAGNKKSPVTFRLSVGAGLSPQQKITFVKEANDHVLSSWEKMINTPGSCSGILPGIEQIAYVNSLPLLITAGDRIDLELSLSTERAGVMSHHVLPRWKTVNHRMALPYRIDSVFNISPEALSKMNFAAFENWLKAGEKKTTHLISKAGKLNASTIALLDTYKRVVYLKLKSAFLTSVKDRSGKPADSKEWLLAEQQPADERLALVASDPEMVTYLNQYLDAVAGNEKWDSANQCKWLLEHIRSDRLKFLLVDYHARLIFRKQGMLSVWKDLYPVIRNAFTNKNALQDIEELYRTFSITLKGKPAADFMLLSDKKEIVRLSDFKGKLVVIDCWGTWCGGCVQALPYFLKIADKYKDSTDIVFLNIAYESSDGLTPWYTFIQKHKMENYKNLHLPFEDENKENLNLRTNYNLTGVPRYMLIDKAGNFYEAFCPSPMTPEYQQLIDNFYKEAK